MTGRDVELMERAEALALRLTRAGLQRMSARVLSVLLFNPSETITAGEIAQVLSASPGTISTTIRSLERSGLIERVPKGRSRREQYRFPDDGWARLMSSQNETLNAMAEAAHAGKETVDPDSPAGRRLARMADFYDHLRSELPGIIAAWEQSDGGRRTST
ncbi:MAG TPA: helix-turn-helix domain-containing protein [Microlunatus sp.]|nr:helix-turn-helix domain-containing protein [Microlunatus sp.]